MTHTNASIGAALSARIIRLLASKYPSGLYGEANGPQAYPGYGGLPQGSMFGPHMNGLHGEGVEGADGMMHGLETKMAMVSRLTHAYAI